MTPKEKAMELVDIYFVLANGLLTFEQVKQCALIAVDEIIKVFNPENWGLEMDNAFESKEYWEKVKQEIEKL